MSADLEAAVDRLVDERPGPPLLTPVYDDPAVEVAPGIWRSGGYSAAYAVDAGDVRMIVNCGLGYEAVHHRRVLDAACPKPTRYIVTTQGHVDHVGGVARFREPGAAYVAQANNPSCQRDDARIAGFRGRTSSVWFDVGGADAARIAAENPGVPMTQDTPVPDVTFERRLGLRVGRLDVELLAAVGETVDSAIVWLPERRVAMISNLLGPMFPHFPNLNTIRGDRYRMVEPYLASIRTLRELRPDVLVMGRYEPVRGADLLDAALRRLHDAVEWVHATTLDGINAGVDVDTLMREVRLPAHLRVGEGYGKVAWGVRTIWETYVGWFRFRSTTELYPDDTADAMAELVAAAGTDATLALARRALAGGRPVVALHLAEAAGGAAGAREVLVEAHRALLEAGGAANFWEAGWLRHQLARIEAPDPAD